MIAAYLGIAADSATELPLYLLLSNPSLITGKFTYIPSPRRTFTTKSTSISKSYTSTHENKTTTYNF